MKSRMMRSAGHVSVMTEMKTPYKILVGKSEGKRYLEDTDVDGE
jgi:hypothetical protein